jgi:hypothetical protein
MILLISTSQVVRDCRNPDVKVTGHTLKVQKRAIPSVAEN